MDAGARCWHERGLSAPTRVVDNLHGISAPTRVVDTSARYIPLAVSTTPSRCRRPPHGADNARPYRQRALELAPGPTTRVHTRGSTPRQGRARCGHGRQRASTPGGTPAPGPGALRTRSTWTRSTTPTTRGHARTRARPQEDCSGSRTAPSEYAHKDPDSRNTHRTQGRDQALVCGPVLPNSLPCVRHQRTRTPKKDGAKEQTHQPTANPNQQTGQPAEEETVNRMGPARTTWGPAPAPLRRNPLGPSSGCGRCRQPLLDPGEPAELGGGRGQGCLDGLARQTRQLAVGQPEGVARLGVLLHQA